MEKRRLSVCVGCGLQATTKGLRRDALGLFVRGGLEEAALAGVVPVVLNLSQAHSVQRQWELAQWAEGRLPSQPSIFFQMASR